MIERGKSKPRVRKVISKHISDKGLVSEKCENDYKSIGKKT